MEIQASQFLWVLATLLFIYVGVFFFNSAKIRVFTVFILVAAFAFSPVKFKQEGMAKIERSNPKTFEIKERTYINAKGFEQKQIEELNKLKNQSKGLNNEIHN